MTKRAPSKPSVRTLHAAELQAVQGGKDKKEKEKQDYLKFELENILVSS